MFKKNNLLSYSTLKNNAIFHQNKKINIRNIKIISASPAGTLAKDCEFVCFSYYSGFKLTYRKKEDNTYWSLRCELIVAYKVISLEFAIAEYLIDLPEDGTFFEILDSPWIREFGPHRARILDKCKHYILRFSNKTVEIIAQVFIFEQLKEKPIFNIQN